MAPKPTYEELRQRVWNLEREREKRLHAEEENERRQGYLEAVLRNAPDAVVTLDASHRVVEWNAAAERIFGYSAEEAKGRDLDEMIAFLDASGQAKDYTRQVLDGSSVDSVETVRYTKDGSPVQVLLSGSPIAREGRLTGVVAIYTDISERKRTEEALHASERKYRAIFENTGTATVIIDEDTIVSMVNTEFERLSGYSKEELVGRPGFIPFIAHQSDRERMLEYHRQRRKENVSVPNKYDVDLVNRNGEVKNVFLTVDLIPGSSQSVVSILDVTRYKELQASYKQERDYLDHILEYSPDGIAIVDRHGEFVRFNRMAAELFGYSFAEMRGRRAFDFYADQGEMEKMLQTLRSQGSVRNYEIDFLDKKGDRTPCSLSITLLRDREGYTTGSVSIIRGLREWKDMLQTIREQEEKFAGIASSALDAVIMMDDRGRITYWNPAAEKIFGYTSKEVLNRDLHELLAPQRYRKSFREAFAEFRRKGTGEIIGHRTELRALHKDGSEFPVEVSLSALKLKNSWHSVGIVRDISNRKIIEEKLEKMASTDQLTGAYNRHKFLECLDYEMRRVQRNNAPMSLLMLDIDHFKWINDTHGHSIGDAVLEELVRLILDKLREVDILTRWGGEEFLILAPDTGKLAAVAMAERLRQEVQDHEFPGVGSVTVSLGIAQYEPKETADQLISRVDDRMYQAKQCGRNRVK